MSKRLIALLGNLGSDSGYSLIKAGMELDGFSFGSCIIVESTISVLDLINRASDENADDLVLVIPGYSRESGLSCTRTVTPIEKPESLYPDDLVRRLWQNLTGSLDPEDYIEALRVFWRKPFQICECNPRSGDCISVLKESLKSFCMDSL